MSSSSEQEDLEMPEDSSDEEVDAGIADEDTDEGGESEAGESEAEESDDEDESGAQPPALDASETESDADDDDEVDDDEDIPPPKKAAKPDQRMDKIQQDVIEKYKKRQGKQLYIRFPAKLPENAAEFDKKVKSLSELIVEAHKPRQKHARFCLVSFANTEDRDKTLKKLSKNSAETKLVVSLPRTDSDDFVKTIADKKLKAIEKKRAKLLLKKENKKALLQKEFTSTIVVLNIPKSASAAQVKELFPDAIDMQIKPAPSKFNGASIATITFPSTADARKNVKRNLSLGGTKLLIRFNNPNKKRNKHQKKKTERWAQQKKGPLVPPTGATNGNQKKKNKNKANGAKPAEQPEKTVVGPSVEGKSKAAKKNKANGAPGAEEPSSAKKVKQQDDTNLPQKNPKQAVEGKFPSKKGKQAGNAKGNKKFPQKQGKKPNQQNKQKKKPLK